MSVLLQKRDWILWIPQHLIGTFLASQNYVILNYFIRFIIKVLLQTERNPRIYFISLYFSLSRI